MTDSQARFDPLDPGRIEFQSREELHYWSREFQCTEAQLLDAINRVGNHVTAVRECLELARRTASHRRSSGGDRPG